MAVISSLRTGLLVAALFFCACLAGPALADDFPPGQLWSLLVDGTSGSVEQDYTVPDGAVLDVQGVSNQSTVSPMPGVLSATSDYSPPFSISASSVGAGGPAWKAVDGDGSTAWITGSSGVAWWEVDFGSLAEVTGFSVNYGFSGVEFQGSRDGTTWVGLLSNPTNGGFDSVPSPDYYRYYRFLWGNESYNQSMLSEFTPTFNWYFPTGWGLLDPNDLVVPVTPSVSYSAGQTLRFYCRSGVKALFYGVLSPVVAGASPVVTPVPSPSPSSSGTASPAASPVPSAIPSVLVLGLDVDQAEGMINAANDDANWLLVLVVPSVLLFRALRRTGIK